MFNIGLSTSIVVLNYLLIPVMGLSGAALSNALALTALNLLRTWFVWRSFGLQPFNARLLRIAAVAAVAGTAAWLLPTTPNIWLNLLLRGGTLTLLYAAGILLTRAAPEVSALAGKVWARLR